MTAGLDPEQFWEQTFATYSAALKGAAIREEHAFKHRAWLAWHTAALMRIETLPKLDTLVASASPHQAARARKTPEELLAVAQSWAAITAGDG